MCMHNGSDPRPHLAKGSKLRKGRGRRRRERKWSFCRAVEIQRCARERGGMIHHLPGGRAKTELSVSVRPSVSDSVGQDLLGRFQFSSASWDRGSMDRPG